MNLADADSILKGLCGPFTKRLTDDEREVWLAALCELDGRNAAAVAINYGKQGERFPTLPEFRRSVRTYAEREEPKHDLFGNVPRSKPPVWVLRWVAARFLYARFGKEKDGRRFPEQQEWADPALDVMPADAWLGEARQISDAEAWSAVRAEMM